MKYHLPTSLNVHTSTCLAKDGVRAIKINDDQVLQKAPVLFKRESLFQQRGPVNFARFCWDASEPLHMLVFFDVPKLQ